MEDWQPAIPCGLVAKSVFTDTFANPVEDSTKDVIELDQTKIAWATDLEFKFNNIADVPPAVLTNFTEPIPAVSKIAPAGKENEWRNI